MKKRKEKKRERYFIQKVSISKANAQIELLSTEEGRH